MECRSAPSEKRPRTVASRRFNPLANLLGEPDEDAFRATDVTEPILVLVLRQLTDQRRQLAVSGMWRTTICVVAQFALYWARVQYAW
jgi:hypothetical protein